MTKASEEILEHGWTFLQRKVKLVVRTAQVEIAVNEKAAEVYGNRGGIWRKLGVGMRSAGILTGTATTIAMSLAAANFWNPAGWILAAVSVGGGIISGVLGWLGGKSERKAEETRASARREALASAQKRQRDAGRVLKEDGWSRGRPGSACGLNHTGAATAGADRILPDLACRYRGPAALRSIGRAPAAA
jgi:hypothetical protein